MEGDPAALVRLAVALAAGLLIGIERGWRAREAREGTRVAGVRTFGLVGLLGGLWGELAGRLDPLFLAAGFLAFAAVAVAGHLAAVRLDRDVGITTVVAALVTFALGALAARGELVVAAAGAVVTALLLSLKPALHAWLRRLAPVELRAALQLALISIVVLPVLPDRGYGPWQALNPYVLWWMVVLIAALSFAGYAAMRIVGPGRGVLLTGLLGGLASSTAVALGLGRLARDLGAPRLLAAGIVVASATMFPRMLVEVAAVNPGLVPAAAPPLGIMTALAFLAAWVLARRSGGPAPGVPLGNPLRLGQALQFGLLLAAVTLAAHAFEAWLGDEGVYALAAVAGLGDVDAVTLALARMADEGLEASVAVRGMVLAAVVNTAVKAGLAAAAGGRTLGFHVAVALAPTVLAGAACLLAVA